MQDKPVYKIVIISYIYIILKAFNFQIKSLKISTSETVWFEKIKV